MIKNRDYPLYMLEEYESFHQMVRQKAQKCGMKVAFQYMRGKTVNNVTYQQYLDDVLITGKYLSEHCDTGSHIAILGENSYQWLVAFMAIITPACKGRNYGDGTSSRALQGYSGIFLQ